MTKQQHSLKGALLRTVNVNPLTGLVKRVAHVTLAESTLALSLPFDEFLTSKVFMKCQVSSVTIEDEGMWVHRVSPLQCPKILKKIDQRLQDHPLIRGGLLISYPTSRPATIKYNKTLDQPYYKIRVGSKILWVTQKTYDTFFCKSDSGRDSTPPSAAA